MNKLFVNLVGYGGAALLPWVVPSSAAPAPQSTLAVLWSIHFMKRVLECVFVHKWSDDELPWVMGLGEIAYYWFFTCWNMLALTPSGAAGHSSALLAFFWLGLTCNGLAHVQLARIRRDTAQRDHREIPQGALFSRVSSPHYTAEILMWLAWAAMARNRAAAVWAAAIVVVLAIYAQDKHIRYKATFKFYPQRRKSLIPFVW